MCAEPVGGKGRKFLEEGRCQGGEAVPSEQSLLCRKPQLRENVRGLAPPPSDLAQPVPPASSSWVPGMPCEPLPPSPPATGLRGACPREGLSFPSLPGPSGTIHPGQQSAQCPPRLLRGQRKWGASWSGRWPPRLCRNWAERMTAPYQDEAERKTRRAGPGFP